MRRIAFLPTVALAAVIGAASFRPAPQEPSPAETPAGIRETKPVESASIPPQGETKPAADETGIVDGVRATPLASLSAPRRGSEPAPTADIVSTEPAPPQIPLPSDSPQPVIVATVTLPDGAPWVARAPLPEDPQGFTWRTFKSRSAPGKSILGLHVYAQRQEPDLVVGSIRWSNGTVSPKGTGFCGGVYYDSFVLNASDGWEWVILPQKGQGVRGNVWVVAAAPTNGEHFARPREMLEFSYALIQAGNERARARAMSALRYKDLQIPSPFIDYGPAHTTLPTVDRAKMSGVCGDWAVRLLAAQAGGTKLYIDNIADFQSEALGPHWMDGQPAAYAHGGYGIDPTGEFAEQVPEAVLAHAIMHRANVSRSFIAAFDPETGLPIGLNDWAAPPNGALMSGEPGHESEVEILPFLTGTYYTYHYPRFNVGKCSYEFARTATVNGEAVWMPGLWDYYAHDTAHSIREVRNAMALVEYAHDPAARDDILMVAETNRYGWFSNRKDEATPKKNPSLGYWPTTLTSQREWIDDHPHQGAWFDRNWAWSAFSGACAIEYERDPVRKAGFVEWGKDMLEARRLATDKFGFAGRNYAPGYLPANVSGLQTFHEMLVICHTVTLGMQVYGTVPHELVENNRRALTSTLAVLKPRDYGGSLGPPHWFGIAENNVELVGLDEAHAYGEGDPAHVYAACALTYRADPTHPEVLDLALKHWQPSADLPAMWSFCKAMTPNKAWSVQMESVLEQKLVH